MSRHYVITLQSADATEPHSCGTADGLFDGYTTEADAFEAIRAAACEKLTRISGRAWTPQNSAVLFYRLHKNT